MYNSEERKNKRDEKIRSFNHNENGLRNHGIFGLPFEPLESELVILPISWEATVSYRGGTGLGPHAILEASQQIDLADPLYPEGWKHGISMFEIKEDIAQRGIETREKTERYLTGYFQGQIDHDLQHEINHECAVLKETIKNRTQVFLEEGKFVGLLGGDHSVSLGYFEALSENYPSFGILQIDAHADLRDAYEGLEYSHASIFFNALKNEHLSKLVQVGIRDFSDSEARLMGTDRVTTFTDYEIKKALFKGENWDTICNHIVEQLPQNVCISFDIDGLNPALAPHTGTPVPGGLSLEEVTYLFEKVLESGRKIVGFDLVEVAPGKEDEWDSNVGARVLYKLCLLALKSRVTD